MHIKRVCQFLLDKEKNKLDAKLRFRIKWNSNKNIVSFNLGYKVNINKWSKATQRCFKNTTHGTDKISASIINQAIDQFETFAETTFEIFEETETFPTPVEFRTQFNILRGKETAKELTLQSYIKMFKLEVGKMNQWTPKTHEKFTVLSNHLERFNENLALNDINEQILTKYMMYLIKVAKMRNSTVKKHLSILKWFLRWAYAKGHYTNNDFLNFKPKLKTVPNKLVFLDWDELMTIYNYEFNENQNYLERVRDVFCFCCFTSLRYSDVKNLKRSNISKEHINITTVKTSDPITIDLNNYSKAILKKYDNVVFDNSNALPVISNQRMNEYIKTIGEKCGINQSMQISYYIGTKRFDDVHKKYELMTTHTGRRTFICISLMLGIQPNIVMKWTGHSDYKSMKPYIDVTDNARKSAMNEFNLVPDIKKRD